MKSMKYIWVLGVCVVMASGCLASVFSPPPPVQYPDLIPSEGTGTIIPLEFTFQFEKNTENIRINIDDRLYTGAKSTDKRVYLYKEVGDEEWLIGYYHSLMEDEDLEPVYSDLLGKLREVKSNRDLDQDEYLELITVFVQSIPYANDQGDTDPKYPVETLVEGEGDCDDKSLLLASLLAREGYDVALFYYDEEKHMAVGTKSSTWTYAETGYAFIESTNVTFVGVQTSTLDDGSELQSNLLVIPVEGGEQEYGCGDETHYIYSVQMEAKAKADEIKSVLDDLGTSLSTDLKEIEELGRKMDTLLKNGNYAAYNGLIPGYNRRVSEYEAQVREFNVLRAEYNSHVEMHNYIITHQFDRKGTYIWVNERMAAIE